MIAPLLVVNTLHLLRARLLVILLVFAFVVQWLGLHFVGLLNTKLQGVFASVMGNETLFVSLFYQLFTGGFVAAVYGIWMVPYLHHGSRNALTFVLPLPRWAFSLGYGVTMLLLLLALQIVMLLTFGTNLGFSVFSDAEFPWKGLLMCVLLQTLAFETLMFAFALGSLMLGPVPTFFLGGTVVFALQVGGAFFRIDLENFTGELPAWYATVKKIYDYLPPLGELIFDLRQQFLTPSIKDGHFWLWAGWLALFVLLFTLRLGRPSLGRGATDS